MEPTLAMCDLATIPTPNGNGMVSFDLENTNDSPHQVALSGKRSSGIPTVHTEGLKLLSQRMKEIGVG